MASKAANGTAEEALSELEKQQQTPLLEDAPAVPQQPKKTPTQKCLKKTFQGTANLSNLLPTGAVLTFQMLSPSLSNQGNCHSSWVYQYMTAGLVCLCCIGSFLLRFTDSFKDEKGKAENMMQQVRHGMATLKGLWVLDAQVKLPPEVSARYRLRFVDFVHAFMSMFVFAATALADQSVVGCFYTKPSEDVQALLSTFPILVGVVTSSLFVMFPTKRHGIGFPLTRE